MEWWSLRIDVLAIRSFDVLEVDNVNGTKVVMKINQFILLAVYAPPSLGVECLQHFLIQANDLARDGSPVVLCGDLNEIHRRHHKLPAPLIQTKLSAPLF